MIDKQPRFNVGITGQVAHGKTSLVKEITGKHTITKKQEKERNITIDLGYAKASIYHCQMCDIYYSNPLDIKDEICKKCNSHLSFKLCMSLVDCPGHDSFMSTMINGAAVMNMAINVIAANQDCPQEQTYEHLQATEILGVNNYIMVQNKLDLVDRDQALKNASQIKDFIKNTKAEKAAIIPTQVQNKTINNVGEVLREIVKLYNNYDFSNNNDSLYMVIVRTFKTSKTGSRPNNLTGGVIGGSIMQGTLRIGDTIAILPGKVTYVGGNIKITPYFTQVTSLKSEKNDLDQATSGGLIGIGTNLDPLLTMSNGLLGNVIVKPNEKYPPITMEIDISFYLLEKGQQFITSPSDIKKKNILIHVLSMEICAYVSKINREEQTIHLILDKPICAKMEQRITIIIDNRLIAWGEIKGMKELEIEKDKLENNVLKMQRALSELPEIVYNTVAPLKDNTPKLQNKDKTSNNYEIEYAVNKENCRMYKNEFPNEGDIVNVHIDKVDKTTNVVYVTLLEYNDLEAFCLFSNLSKKKYIKNIGDVIKVGKNDVMSVICVDDTIELSKRDISEDDVKQQTKQFSNNIFVQNIMKKCSYQLGITLYDIYNKYIWPIDEGYNIHEILLRIAENELYIEKYKTVENSLFIETLLKEIKKKMNTTTTDIIATIKISNEDFCGIKNIQFALNKAEELNDNENQIVTQLDSPPFYNVYLKTTDRENANNKVWDILNTIKHEVVKYNGNFELKNLPIYSNSDPISPLKPIKQPEQLNFNELFEENDIIDSIYIICKSNYIHNKVISMNNKVIIKDINSIDIYFVKRKSRKYQTKVCGIKNMNVMKQLVKSFGKEHSCSAVTIADDKLGDIIVIQGDFCNQMKTYLINTDLYKDTDIKLHGIEDISGKSTVIKNNNSIFYDNIENDEKEIILPDQYYQLLDKLNINVEHNITKITYPKLSFDAKNTKIDNFIKICNSICIISKQVYKEIDTVSKTEDIYNMILNIKLKFLISFIENDLSTITNYINGSRELKLAGKFKKDQIANCIMRFVKEYLMCGNNDCNNIDTRLEKEGRIYQVKCTKCNFTKFVKNISK